MQTPLEPVPSFSRLPTDAQAASAGGTFITAPGNTLVTAFDRPGEYVAIVRCVAAGSVPDFAPMDQVTVVVDADPGNQRFFYRVEQPPPIASAAATGEGGQQLPKLFVTVWDRFDLAAPRAQDLTAQLVHLRATPVVRIAGLAKKSTPAEAVACSLPLDGGAQWRVGWSILFPEAWQNSETLIKLSVDPPGGVALLGHAISPSVFHLSSRYRWLPQVSGSVHGPTTAAPSGHPLITEASRQSSNRRTKPRPLVDTDSTTLYQNLCRPMELTLVLSRANTSAPFGLIFTNDLSGDREFGMGTDNYRSIPDVRAWVCLELTAMNSQSVCVQEICRKGTALLHVVPLVSSYQVELLLLIRTENGDTQLLYFTQSIQSNSNSDTGHPHADASASLTKVAGSQLMTFFRIAGGVRSFVSVPAPCVELALSSQDQCVYFAGKEVSQVVYRCGVPTGLWHHQSFSHVPSRALGILCVNLSASVCKWHVASAHRDFYRNSHVYLAVSLNAAQILIQSSQEGMASQLSIGFSFPAVVTTTENSFEGGKRVPAVSAMDRHANGYDLLAYGREVWRSISGGLWFQKLFAVPHGAVADVIATTTFKSGYAVMTGYPHRRLYYGRIGVSHAAELLTPFASTKLPLIYWSESGQLLASEVGTISANWLLSGASNTSESFAVSPPITLPYESAAQQDDWAFLLQECDLIPSWFTGHVRVICSGRSIRCPSDCFRPIHSGRRIVARDSGEIRIQLVHKGTAYGVVVGTLQNDARYHSCASSLSLTFVLRDRTSTAQCNSEWWAVFAPTAIGGKCARGGWSRVDEGKALLVSGLTFTAKRSYSVLSVRNRTHAVTKLHFGSTCKTTSRSEVNAVSNDIVTEWQLYDFRSYREGALSHRSLRLGALHGAPGMYTAAPLHFSGADSTVNSTDLGATSVGSATKHTEVLLMPFATHVGITVNGVELWGAVVSRNNTSFDLQLSPTAMSDASAVVTDWTAFLPARVPDLASHSLRPDLIQRQRSWKLLIPPCDYPSDLTFEEQGGYLGSMVRYVDVGRPEILRGQRAGKQRVGGLRISRVHPSSVSVQVSDTEQPSLELESGKTFVNVSVSITAGLRNRTSAVQIQLGATPSLRCAGGAHSVLIFPGCSPTTRLALADTAPSFPGQIVGTGNILNTKHWTVLRPNYRPPSSKGRAIPTSKHIYNANPVSAASLCTA
jgi:hypothetical protein